MGKKLGALPYPVHSSVCFSLQNNIPQYLFYPQTDILSLLLSHLAGIHVVSSEGCCGDGGGERPAPADIWRLTQKHGYRNQKNRAKRVPSSKNSRAPDPSLHHILVDGPEKVSG